MHVTHEKEKLYAEAIMACLMLTAFVGLIALAIKLIVR